MHLIKASAYCAAVLFSSVTQAAVLMGPLTTFSPNSDGWLAPGEGGYTFLGTANNERGIAFGNGHVYLVSRTGGNFIRILNGSTGADLGALCREAAMTALRAALPDAGFGAPLPDDRLASLQVGMDDFRSALTEIAPSAMRDLRVDVPDVPWDEVGGLAQVKQQLREAVEWPLGMPDLLRRAGVRPPRGILLYGPPGTGKTLLARALASQSGINFVSVKGPALLTKYVGESERAVRDLFKRARQCAPCVLLFDEIDALAPPRGGAGDEGHVAARVVAQLLTELDGIEDLEGVLVVGTTNRRDMVDPALLRPGRFDLLLEVSLPDADARAAIFRVHLSGKPIAAGVDVPDLAVRTSGFSGAAIASACRRAALMAVRRSLVAGDTDPLITIEDLLAAIAEIDAQA